jgi:glycosyltransferase involved in cell wall biosynthesis
VRLLAVNWQDIDNPHAGGAEIHLHEIFERLARRGHEVALLCGGWPGAPSHGTHGGIHIHRVGTRHTFPFLARRYYVDALARRGEHVLIEDINKVPLYTPLWGAPRVMALVPHLFGGTAFQEAAAPLAAAVWLAERPLARMYRGVPFEAISDSTADDLARRGVPRETIRVIYPGVHADRYTPEAGVRSPGPLFVYLGRLKRYKGVDIVVRAFARVTHPGARLHIAGTGDHRPALERLIASLDLGRRVSFLGFISEEEKLALLRRAWALAFASPKEGWGMTNLEAAACATPVIASDSPGLRESVVHGETGLLVPHGDVAAMAAAMERIASSPDLVRAMGERARRFAEGFTWDRAALETERHLREIASPEARPA